MLGWFAEKLFGLIPFLHGRHKARSNAQSKFQYLKAQLVLYALQGSQYAGHFDQHLVSWGKGQLASVPALPEYKSYSEIEKSLEVLLQNPEAVSLAYRLRMPTEHGITKIFPTLDKPSLDEIHLSRRDVGLSTKLAGKINAINTICEDIRRHHDRSFDNSLNSYQHGAVRDSINAAYLSLSQQAQDAADTIAAMDLMAQPEGTRQPVL